MRRTEEEEEEEREGRKSALWEKAGERGRAKTAKADLGLAHAGDPGPHLLQ
jgi:hypothetical protein